MVRQTAINRNNHSTGKLLCFFLILSLAAIFLVGCGGGSNVTLSSLTISPATPSTGQTVSIAVNVLNPGTSAISGYELIFSVNNVKTETKTVNVNPSETATITFEYVPTSAGDFSVSINNQTGTFKAVAAAAFKVGELKINPVSPVAGEEITVTTEVKNEGGASGIYAAKLLVDGKEIKSENLTIAAGQTASFSASYKPATSGSSVFQVGDSNKSVKIIKPATYEATSININPGSALIGQPVSINAKITNSGEVSGELPVALMVNGTSSSSKSVSLEPGASTTVEFTYTPTTSGSKSIGILESSTTLTVTALSTYTNESYFYTISYPPDYDVVEVDAATVAIERENVGGISILVDKLSTSETALDYFNGVATGKKQQLPDWTYSNRTEIKENGVIIGYKYDYTNTTDGQQWTGKGMVFKKSGFGFYVVYTTKNAYWEQNKQLAPAILDSFVLPPIFSGQYANLINGINLSLPSEWTAFETGASTTPLMLYYSTTAIQGQIIAEAVSADTTARAYLDVTSAGLVQNGWIISSQNALTFSDANTGYEMLLTGQAATATYKARLISVLAQGNMYTVFLFGVSTEIDPQQTAITQMAKSLTITDTSALGLNKDESLYLLEGEVPTLDPALTEEAAEGIVGAIFSGLVRIDQNLELVPDLAESWTVSTDGTVYTFKLRHNASFHSGQTITAADVKYSWERACDPALKAPKAMYFLNDIVGATDMINGTSTQISGIKVIDDYTLEVTIDTAKQYFLYKLAQPIAFIVNRTNVATGDKWYETPDGTGPFALKTWEKNSFIILERYEKFYQGSAKLKNIAFKIYAGLPMTLYENGEIDITGVYYTDQDRVLNTADPLHTDLVTAAVASFDYVGFNVNKPPFDDPKVREAFALALDVDKLLEISIKGRGQHADGIVPESVPGFNPALQAIPYDIERAKKLIAESKYGSVENLPAIEMMVIYGTSALQEAIIGMWQQNLGVTVSVEKITEIQTYMDRQRNHEFQVFSSGWRADYLDPQNFLEILFKTGSTENNFAYSNAQVDALLAAAGVDNNATTRVQKYQQIEQLILADYPVVPLFRDTIDYVLVNHRVKGYLVLPMGISQWRDIYIVGD